MPNMTQRFKDQLDRQLGFLENSCYFYDCGAHEESIRIATVVRVLMHDTKNSTSLLTKLNVRHIALLDTCRPIPDPLTGTFHGLGVRTLTPNGGILVPSLDRSTKLTSRPCEEWWNQTVCVSATHSLTRAMIVRAAANKDGGAHVDDLPIEYAELATPGYLAQVVDRGGAFTEAHLVALRQIGYELLNSRPLVELAVGATPLFGHIPASQPSNFRRMQL